MAPVFAAWKAPSYDEPLPLPQKEDGLLRKHGGAWMHTAETLEHAINLAARLGYDIRHDWLGGSGGGGCVLKGRKLLLIDLALGTADQLDQVLDALRHDPEAPKLPMPHGLRELLKFRHSA